MLRKNLKKIISVILVMSMLVISLASCKGKLKIEDFTVLRSSIKTDYYVGDKIDFSGIRVEVKYSDEELNTVLTIDNVTLQYPQDITATPGEKTVTVKFHDEHTDSDYSASVKINVMENPNAPKHQSYVADASEMKTEYAVGETIDFTGLKIVEKLTNGGADVVITDLSKVTYEYDANTITSEPGIDVIHVLYDGEDAGFITVNIASDDIAMVITGMEIAGLTQTTYMVGEPVNFDGVYVNVSYHDIVKPASNLTFSTVDTSTAGEKNVVVSFRDPMNNCKATLVFKITVIAEKAYVTRFEKPASLVQFDYNNKAAGTSEHGAVDFAGQFYEGATYLIGDDNAFRLVPLFATKSQGITNRPTAFYTNVSIALNGNNLTAVPDPTAPTIVKYYNGESLIVTVDTYYGSYDFTEVAVDSMVTISVLPSEEHYQLGNINPITLEAKVIDAYNVYEAWQLAVIEKNESMVDREGDTDERRTEWDSFKAAHGITNIHPAAIVFQNDVHLTADDVPSVFFHVSTKDVVYTNKTTGETRVAKAGTRYLEDATYIYYRNGSDDFQIQGNLFTLDLQGFPLVASPAVFDPSLDWDYGSDFSNAALFVFDTTADKYEYDEPTDKAINRIENLHIVGNAGRNSFTDALDGLPSGGGLIFCKARHFSDCTFNNIIGSSFFITYFPDSEATVTINHVKCYDSYQNAMFMWGSAKVTMSNSVLQGAGGPLIVCLSDKDDDSDENIHNPDLVATDVIAINQVTGEELWFSAVNATTIVGSIKALGDGMSSAGMGNFVDSDGFMNVLGMIMNEGYDAQEMLLGIQAQGGLWINGQGLDRWNDSPYWAGVLKPNLIAPDGVTAIPFFTAYGEDGTPYTILFNGSTFMAIDLAQGGMVPLENSPATYMAFVNADHVVLTYGGLSALLEFYHE